MVSLFSVYLPSFPFLSFPGGWKWSYTPIIPWCFGHERGRGICSVALICASFGRSDRTRALPVRLNALEIDVIILILTSYELCPEGISTKNQFYIHWEHCEKIASLKFAKSSNDPLVFNLNKKEALDKRNVCDVQRASGRWGFGWVDRAQCFRLAWRFGSIPDFSRAFSWHWVSGEFCRETSFHELREAQERRRSDQSMYLSNPDTDESAGQASSTWSNALRHHYRARNWTFDENHFLVSS